MKPKSVSKSVTVVAGPRDPISTYASGLRAAEARICRTLRAEIDAVIPGATSRVWHGAPVWFVGETPVVGYSRPAKGGVTLLFWNGQAFDDQALEPMGKFKAAQVHFDDAAQIDSKSLRRWLKKAGKELWDHSAIRRPKPAR